MIFSSESSSRGGDADLYISGPIWWVGAGPRDLGGFWKI